MVSNNATINLKPHRTSVLLVYCTLLPLKIELLHPVLGPAETTQLHRQVGFLLLYYKLDFIILLNSILFNLCSQVIFIVHKFMQLQGCWLKNKCP